MPETDPGTPHVDVGGYLLGTLTEREHDAFEAHVATCPSCQHELEELRDLPALLAQAEEPVDVPAGLESRVLRAIAQEPRRRQPARERAKRERAPEIRLPAHSYVSSSSVPSSGMGSLRWPLARMQAWPEASRGWLHNGQTGRPARTMESIRGRRAAH